MNSTILRDVTYGAAESRAAAVGSLGAAEEAEEAGVG